MKNQRLQKDDRKKSFWTVVGIMSVAAWIWCIFPPGISFAQERNADKNTHKTQQLETITVTAQKQQKENVQEVPISISVLDTGGLEDALVGTIVELSDFVPNLFLYEVGPGTNVPAMRGIMAPTETFQVSTGIYVDGAPVISTAGYSIDLLNIERV